MKENLETYLNAEIPTLEKYHGVKRFFKLMTIRMLNPSYDAVYMCRYVYVYMNTRGIKKLRSLIFTKRLVSRYGIYFNVEPNCSIGKGLFFPHPCSIIIGGGVNIGENCTIYHNVTLGAKKRGEGAKMAYPHIGNGVTLYAGAVVIGPIEVKDGTSVGANAVLTTNTEENSIYAGIPAVRKR